jgi:hypothetical protein
VFARHQVAGVDPVRRFACTAACKDRMHGW